MARYSSSFYQPPPTSNTPQTPPLPSPPNTSHQSQINISTQNGATTTISLQQPQLQVHFSIGETQGHTQQERTVIQIHQSQNSGHVISVENGSFRLQVDNTLSYGGFYSSHTGYTQHTDSVSMATGSSLQETQYTQGSSDLVTHWRTTPPYCTHDTGHQYYHHQHTVSTLITPVQETRRWGSNYSHRVTTNDINTLATHRHS